RTISRPLLVAGRLPNPDRSDEIVVNRTAASKRSISVGDKLNVSSSSELDGGEMNGPSLQATVVGIGDSTVDQIFFIDEPGFILSAAFLSDHPEIPRPSNLVVRLRPGTDITAFRQRAAEAMGLPDIPVRDLAEDGKRLTHGTDLERASLLLFAGAVALAGLVLVGQALARLVYALSESSQVLRALGLTRRGLLAGVVLPFVITAAVAAVAAVITAVALSSRFPVGLAGRLEADHGMHFDWLILAPGALVVTLTVVGGAALCGLRATSLRRDRVGARTAISIMGPLRRVGPPPAVIGAGLALERERGRRALPVRPALAGATAAVLGVVGAFGLLHGIDDALTDRDRSGQIWDADISPDGAHPIAAVLATAAGDDRIAGVGRLRLAEVDAEAVSVQLYALEPVKGNQSFGVLEGHPPRQPNEVVLGPATARALHREVGDRVRFGGTDGQEMRIVGLGLLPQTPHFSFDQGAWMTQEGFDAALPADYEDIAGEDVAVVRFVPGESIDAGIARLEEELGGVVVESIPVPQDVVNLRNVRTLPRALAAFLVLLGLAALGHTLATAVRRRRHDLAVLRAVGFRPLQVAACVSWLAVTVSVVGLVIGVPLGIAAGRWAWRWVADATPLLYIPPVAATVVLIVIPAALVLANAMAAWPARRAALLRPAEVLRAE
ncbi:MAG TPA: FtsX-like permease family protein, partial [Acidimicrobiales bacterium]